MRTLRAVCTTIYDLRPLGKFSILKLFYRPEDQPWNLYILVTTKQVAVTEHNRPVCTMSYRNGGLSVRAHCVTELAHVLSFFITGLLDKADKMKTKVKFFFQLDSFTVVQFYTVDRHCPQCRTDGFRVWAYHLLLFAALVVPHKISPGRGWVRGIIDYPSGKL